MRKRQHQVVLTDEQKDRVRAIAFTGTHPVRHVVVARLLLKAAADVIDADIAEALHLSASTVAATRKRFCQKGLDACLTRKKQQNRARKITGEIEARIAQIACSPAPDGRSRWTLDLLTERIVEMKILPSIGRSAVGEALKKTKSSHGASSASASRPRRMASL